MVKLARKLFGIIIYLALILMLSVMSKQVCAQDEQDSRKELLQTLSDSLLETFSLEDLAEYRDRFLEEITRLEYERKMIRQRGIRDGEIFMQRHPNSKVMDKVMMRMAELYYERAQDRFDEQMLQYDRDLALYDRGELLEMPEEPKRDYTEALEIYDTVIDKMPQSELVDDAMYDKGFLLEELGEFDLARAIYDTLITQFPESRFVPESYMRIAEYYFGPIGNKLETSVEYYEKVLQYKESPRYDEALYRLGWCYYRLDNYPKAISYFTLLADDVNKSKKYDPNRKYTNPLLVQESVEYIGISFLELGGAEGAADYLKDIGDREYGIDILKRIGDAYMREKEDYPTAIKSYNTLLRMYPDSPEAPRILNNIVTCYRRLEDDRMAYLSRELIFSRYREGTGWWKKNSDRDVRHYAKSLTESSLRDNITLLLQRAEQLNDMEFYNTAVKDCKKYLDVFPETDEAPVIHWNMALTLDTKLGQHDAAYEEYLAMSSRYWDTKYQRFAAENAIALAKDAASNAILVADSIARQQRETPSTIGEIKKQGSFREALTMKPTELIDAEVRLAAAYDNFIKLFPEEKETAQILANAGALYYRHNQFKNALRYFNTLVKHFPNSSEVAEAQYMIMESYFGKMDYASAEIVSRRILVNEAAPEKVKSKARRRLAESIFLSAELLAENKHHVEAGDEYRRVVREVPRIKFADLALFNAALEYDNADEYNRAIETYNYLIATHPQSEYLLDAQNNLALDYAELSDYKNAAITFESLARIHPDTSKAMDALFNASNYYIRAKDWKKAVNVNKSYVAKYPSSDDADELAYEIPALYKKMNEYQKASKAYNDFALLFPDSPRVVESIFRRGEYYIMIDKPDSAKSEFNRAIRENKRLADDGLETNDFYAAEAEFALASTKYKEYDAIEFLLPKASMDESKKYKKDLLVELVKHYRNVAKYSTPRVYEATFRIGEVYHEFAATWVEQEIPEVNPTLHVVAKKEINDFGVKLFSKAADTYRNTIKVLTRLVEAYKKSNQDSLSTMQTDSSSIAMGDSLLQVAETWINSTREKLTQTNYDIAELGYSSIKEVLGAPVPESYSHAEKVLYRVKIIDKVISDMAKKTAKDYERGIEEAQELAIASQWVDLSKQKLIAVQSIVPQEIDKIANDCLEYYDVDIDRYSNLIFGGGVADAVETEAQRVGDEAVALIGYSNEFKVKAIKSYISKIDELEKNEIAAAKIIAIHNSLLSSIVDYSRACEDLEKQARGQRIKAEANFRETKDWLFEDALFYFQNAAFDLKKADSTALQQGYLYFKNDTTNNIWARNIILRLIQYNPDKYAPILDLKVTTRRFKSDTTWLMSTTYEEGWVFKDFDDQYWYRAIAGENADTIIPVNVIEKIDTMAVTVGDSVVKKLVKSYTREPSKVGYFRFPFFVKGLPVKCRITITADNAYNLFLNGGYIAQVTDEGSDLVVGKHSLIDFVVEGENILAVQLEDMDSSGKGLNAKLDVRSVPGWKAKQEMLRPDLESKDKQDKLILHKDRIP